MKIPESIIEKYQLTTSGEQVGESFMQNLLLYKSGLPGFENVVFMECDMMGKPTKYITLFNKNKKKEIAATPEYLNAMAIVDMLKFII